MSAMGLNFAIPTKLFSSGERGFWITVGICAFVLPLLILAALNGGGRIAVMIAIAFPMIALAAINIRVAILAVYVYLVLLGDIRRALISLTGWSGADPLLLLGSFFAVIVGLYALASRQVRLDTPLSRFVLALMAVMVLQMFNPKQGGLVVGVAGSIFLLVPLFWYWVAKSYATIDFMRRLLWYVVVPLSLAAMFFGYYQSFYGYLPYQMDWYRIAGYLGLGNLETGLAPISFFASGTEHGAFLLTGGVVLVAAFMRGHRVAIIPVLLIFVAILLTGSRGPVVKLLGVAAILWAVQGRTKKVWVPRVLLAVAIFGIGLAWSLTRITSMSLDARMQTSLERQSQLFESTGERSTVAVHSSLLVGGYASVIKNPLGSGLGATSSAAVKFGEGGRASTETDFGDVMVATGLVGGVLYHIIAVLIVILAVRYWLRTRSLLALAILGILAAHLFLWLGGGLYAISPLVWICIGALDRFEREEMGRSVAQETTPIAASMTDASS